MVFLLELGTEVPNCSTLGNSISDADNLSQINEPGNLMSEGELRYALSR